MKVTKVQIRTKLPSLNVSYELYLHFSIIEHVAEASSFIQCVRNSKLSDPGFLSIEENIRRVLIEPSLDSNTHHSFPCRQVNLKSTVRLKHKTVKPFLIL